MKLPTKTITTLTAMNQFMISHAVNGSSPPGWYSGVMMKCTPTATARTT